ncbi:unnamed protein product [Pleuronectes platessa]|uniref:Uncharacterized protein n=1 Tax=Pleuronectes platessa TaxID=8262 RepID=A0A9N7Y5X1_PLEPL|nr:unnamed protein product [Pleuronectes platessa]
MKNLKMKNLKMKNLKMKNLMMKNLKMKNLKMKNLKMKNLKMSICRTDDFWIGYCCLTPYDTGLVGSTFCLFHEGCTGWLDRIIGPLLTGQEIQPCLVNTGGWT